MKLAFWRRVVILFTQVSRTLVRICKSQPAHVFMKVTWLSTGPTEGLSLCRPSNRSFSDRHQNMKSAQWQQFQHCRRCNILGLGQVGRLVRQPGGLQRQMLKEGVEQRRGPGGKALLGQLMWRGPRLYHGRAKGGGDISSRGSTV